MYTFLSWDKFIYFEIFENCLLSIMWDLVRLNEVQRYICIFPLILIEHILLLRKVFHKGGLAKVWKSIHIFIVMENLSYGQHLAYFLYSDIVLSWNCLIHPCLSYIDLLHPTIQSLYNYTNNSTVNPLGFWIFEPQKSIVLTHIYWKISSFLYNICYLHTICLYLYVQGGGINLLAIRRVLQNQAFSSPFRKLWTSWQSLMLWTYRQGSCLLESWAFQRLATRIKAQESVVQSINLIGYFCIMNFLKFIQKWME